MPYLVVRNDSEALCLIDGRLHWLAVGLVYHVVALQFDRYRAALTCAGIYGANVHTIGEFDDEKDIDARRKARTTRDGRAPGAVDGRGAPTGGALLPQRSARRALVGRSDRDLCKPESVPHRGAPRGVRFAADFLTRRLDARMTAEAEYETVTRITQGRG